MKGSWKPGQNNFWLPMMIAMAFAFGMLVARRFVWDAPVGAQSARDLGAISDVLEFVDHRYVDSLDKAGISQEIINDLLARLDPHSSYFTPEEASRMEEEMQGSFDGIGIEFYLVRDTLQVITVIPGGPGEKAGLLPGDLFLSINDSLVAGKGLDNSDFVRMLRGERDSAVKVRVKRPSSRSVFEVTMRRDRIPIKTVDAALMLNTETGYIKINRFGEKTYEEFMEALAVLAEKQGMRHLVLDLRQNPGGLLNEAVDVLSELFPEKGKLLVYTQGAHAPRKEYKSSGRSLYGIRRLAVLIDEGSASASEILAGAVQDWDRGSIIGRRSFGKGLVQEEYPISGGGLLHLTVARYYTPSGRCIQKPYTAYEGGKVDSLLVIQAERPDTTKAFSSSKGRTLHGGGGITPDITIPLSPDLLDNQLYERLNALNAFIYESRQDPQAWIRSWKQDPDTPLDETLYRRFLKENGIFQNSLSPVQDSFLRTSGKSFLLRKSLGDEAYYRARVRDDAFVKEALRELAKSRK